MSRDALPPTTVSAEALAHAADQFRFRDAQGRREDRGAALAIHVQRQLARRELLRERRPLVRRRQ